MSEKNTEIEQVEVTEETSYVLHFGKPYHFEGETYSEVDLSGIEDLNANDMIAAQRYVGKSGVDILPEMTLSFACFVAARVSKKPIEFYTNLPAKEAIKLKNLVTGFLYGTD